MRYTMFLADEIDLRAFRRREEEERNEASKYLMTTEVFAEYLEERNPLSSTGDRLREYANRYRVYYLREVITRAEKFPLSDDFGTRHLQRIREGLRELGLLDEESIKKITRHQPQNSRPSKNTSNYNELGCAVRVAFCFFHSRLCRK